MRSADDHFLLEVVYENWIPSRGALQEQALSNSWQYNCQDSLGGCYTVYRDQSDIGLPKVTTFPQKVTIRLQLVMLSPKYVNLRALSSISMSRISLLKLVSGF